jgi:cation:H+ antiporter
MTPAVWAWGQFALCAALLAVAGPAVSRYGDAISQLTGLSRTWIGLVLLATATSLPELFTGVSAVAIAEEPDIALGDVLGSCIFNLAILVVIDLMYREDSIYRRIHQGSVLTAGFGTMIIGFAGASILLGNQGFAMRIGHIGAPAPMIILLYLAAMRIMFKYQKQLLPAEPVSERRLGMTLRGAIARYAAAAAVVVAAGTWLPFIGVDIAETMGWRTTFVGTLFLAGATSLPEAFVTISAVRIGALDMAIANLLGSNLFNMLVLAIDDLAYVRGPLLASVSPAHAVTAFSAVFMSGIVIVALIYRPASRFYGTITWVGLSLLTVYILSAYVIYLHGY